MKNSMLSAMVRCIYIVIIPCILFSFHLPPKEKEVSVSGRINLNQDYMIYFVGQKGTASNSNEVLLTEDGQFTWKGKANAPFFLHVGFYPASKNYQMAANFTLLVQPGKPITLDLHYTKETFLTIVSSNLDGGNRALFEYGSFYHHKAYELWKHAPEPALRKEVCEEYITKAASLIKTQKVKNERIKQYLTSWSYNNYLDAMHSFASVDRRGGTVPKNTKDWYPDPEMMKSAFDNEIALQFSSGVTNMLTYVNAIQVQEVGEKSKTAQLEDRVFNIKAVFNNTKVRDALITSLLERYMRGFRLDDPAAFQQTEEEFTRLTAHITNETVRTRLIEGFSGLKYTLTGAEMPDVILKDTDNNDVRLRSFKGKYVYIDLWASWCVPCIKEVPFLQQLEKDYASANITFLSLTLDENKAAWKRKMQELNMHGNQLDAAASGLDKLLNVTGIPQFILYDAEGKLVLLNAPRPSSKELRVILDEIK